MAGVSYHYSAQTAIALSMAISLKRLADKFAPRDTQQDNQ